MPKLENSRSNEDMQAIFKQEGKVNGVRDERLSSPSFSQRKNKGENGESTKERHLESSNFNNWMMGTFQKRKTQYLQKSYTYIYSTFLRLSICKI